MKVTSVATAGTLAAIGGLHVAWGFGSTFPFDDHTTLADTVAGTQAVPSRRSCFAIAGLLAAAAVIVSGRSPLRRIGSAGVGLVLAVRGVSGVTGQTSRLVGWETSPTFVEIDRRRYGPLCLALSAGAWRAALDR